MLLAIVLVENVKKENSANLEKEDGMLPVRPLPANDKVDISSMFEIDEGMVPVRLKP